MQKSWRGPHLLAVVLIATCAAASTTSISAASEPSTLARTLQSKDATEAAAAAYWLGFKGKAAVPVIPRLIAALSDDRPARPAAYRSGATVSERSTPGEEAAGALVRLGKPSVDPLINALRASSSPVARRNAAWALGQIDSAEHGQSSLRPHPRDNPQF